MARAAAIVRGSGAASSKQSGDAHASQAGDVMDVGQLPGGRASAARKDAASGGIRRPFQFNGASCRPHHKHLATFRTAPQVAVIEGGRLEHCCICPAGGDVSGDSVQRSETSATLSASAQDSSAERLRGDALADSTASGGRRGGPDSLRSHDSGGRAGMVASIEGSQLDRQVGSGASTSAAAQDGIAAVASATSVLGLADGGDTAELVQGGPDEKLAQIRAGQGSVTEVLTAEQNAALLKVRPICPDLSTAVAVQTLAKCSVWQSHLHLTPKGHILARVVLTSRLVFFPAQGAAERRARLEARILAKAGRIDEGRADLYGGASGQRARLWARWFDPTTMKLPADVCAPFQAAGVRLRPHLLHTSGVSSSSMSVPPAACSAHHAKAATPRDAS